MGRSEKQKQRSGAGSRKSNVKKNKKPKRVKQRARKHTDKLKPRRQAYDNPRGGNALVGSSRQHARISRQNARMVGRNATRVEDVVDLTKLAAAPLPEPVQNTAPPPRSRTPNRARRRPFKLSEPPSDTYYHAHQFSGTIGQHQKKFVMAHSRNAPTRARLNPHRWMQMNFPRQL